MSVKRWMIPVGVAGVAGLAVLASILGRNTVKPEESRTATAPASKSSPAGDGSNALVEHRDDAGFSLSYPGSWRRVQAADPQVHLLVAPNESDSFQLRVVPLAASISEADLPAVKELTDQVVTSGAGVQPVGTPRQISVDGLPGWYYLYRFTDKATGTTGIHSHYFIFHGDKMITFVFQALPETSFEGLAPVFDQIVSTFKVTGR
ncbi:MAG: hypothetical protein AB1679_23480 [Actinomycetota bacterium]